MPKPRRHATIVARCRSSPLPRRPAATCSRSPISTPASSTRLLDLAVDDATPPTGVAAQPRRPHDRLRLPRAARSPPTRPSRPRSTGSARCPLMLTPDALPEDDALMLSSACDGIVIHGARHRDLTDVAACASVPVVNARSREHDPCHALAHCLALRERFGTLAGLSIAYVGPAGASGSLVVAGRADRPVRIASAPARRRRWPTRGCWRRPAARRASSTIRQAP